MRSFFIFCAPFYIPHLPHNIPRQAAKLQVNYFIYALDFDLFLWYS